MDLLARGLDWLSAKLKTKASRTVIYRRGAASVTLAAVLGRTRIDVEDAEGVTVRSYVRDFLLRADDLRLGGDRILPQPGDRIEEAADDGTYIHEVLPLAGGDCWRWSDPHRTIIRVHTRQVGHQP